MNKNNVLSKIPHCLLVVLLTFGIALTVEAQQGFYVSSAGGTSTSFSYKNVSKLTFQNEIMTTVSPAGVSGQSFVLSTTAAITFGDVNISGLNGTLNGDSNIRLFPTPALTSIHLTGASEGAQVTVFSLTGSKVMQFETTSTEQTIDVSTLNKGIYLLLVDGQTFKFSKL